VFSKIDLLFLLVRCLRACGYGKDDSNRRRGKV